MAGEDGSIRASAASRSTTYTKAIGQAIEGLKIGVVQEGFGQYDSHPDVDAGVRAAAKVLEGSAPRSTEISIPWHPIGIPIWAAIALEGTLHAMVKSAAAAQRRRRLPRLARGHGSPRCATAPTNCPTQ